MSDTLIHFELKEVLNRLRWQEAKDGKACHQTRYDAMCKALGLLNRATRQERFTNTRRALFSVMNEAKKNLKAA